MTVTLLITAIDALCEALMLALEATGNGAWTDEVQEFVITLGQLKERIQ